MAASVLSIEIDCADRNSIIERSASAPSSPNERTSVLREIGNLGGHVKGRRVTFPDDETIVTGYFEAPDPWGEEYDISTDNIVSAYRATCWKQGVKPLQKVLHQLQCVNVNEHTEFELNLEGENLNAHHCEALEEIFKRLQFRSLHLENCHLDDEGAAAIFDMIEYYDSTSYLTISSNKGIGNQGWQACSKMLKKTPCLQYLDASNTSQNEQSLLILGRAFRTGCFLSILHLKNCGIYGRSLVILVAALKLNITLTELYLGDNKICSADGLQLGNLLRSNSNLELLDLANNNLQDLGVCHLVDGLCQQAANNGQCLKGLVLKNNHLTVNGMAHINRALLVSDSLSTLDISDNNICDEGIQYLKQGLLSNQALQNLSLRKSKITCEGAVALAEFIADDLHIARMDLSENDLRVAGIMALALALKVNQSMVNMQLEGISDDKTTLASDEINSRNKHLADIQEYCKRNRDAIECDELAERNINFVVQNSIPTITNEAELVSLLQQKAPVLRTQSTSNSHHASAVMVGSASFPAGSKIPPQQSSSLPRNRFQVRRVYLDTDKKNSSNNSSSDEESLDSKNRSDDVQSEESVFLPSSPNESGYNSNSSSPLVHKSERYEDGVGTPGTKGIMRHQDSLAIHKQKARISSHASVDGEEEDIEVDEEEDKEQMNGRQECIDVAELGERVVMPGDIPNDSGKPTRRMSGQKVVKKLTFVLPEDFEESYHKIKDRRMSTPALASNRIVKNQPNTMNFKLGRQLEGLDLKSSVPLSPTRLREGLIFPEPFDREVVMTAT